MKKMAPFLIKRYTGMSGDKKVRIALDLSKLVREVRKSGSIAMGDNSWKSTKQNFSK